jgi:hypothetical protein
MWIRILIGIAIGAGLGALLGATNSCADGACPLTATPWRGAIWGAVLGVGFALSIARE